MPDTAEGTQGFKGEVGGFWIPPTETTDEFVFDMLYT